MAKKIFKSFGAFGRLVYTSHTPSRSKSGYMSYTPRRARHIKAQMKYFSSPRFKWDYASNKKRDTSLW